MKNRLRELREQRHFTQQQLAIKSGIGNTTISSIETRASLNPSVDIAFKLAKALGVSIEDIFYELDDI